MKHIFNFDELMIPGTHIQSTDTFAPVSAFIRGAEEGGRLHSVAEGLEAFCSPNIPSHHFIVSHITPGGNIMCSEMTWPYDPATSHNGHNVFNLTEVYGLDRLGNHITGVYRYPGLDESEELQAWATRWQHEMHHRGLEYGIGNLFAYLGIGKYDNRKEVCIQYGLAFDLALATVTNRFSVPASFTTDRTMPAVISLEEYAIWACEQGWAKRFVKLVDESYDPTKEITE